MILHREIVLSYYNPNIKIKFLLICRSTCCAWKSDSYDDVGKIGVIDVARAGRRRWLQDRHIYRRIL